MDKTDLARWRFPTEWEMDIIKDSHGKNGLMVTFSLVHHTATGPSAPETIPMILDAASIERLAYGLSTALAKIRANKKA
ncbi:MAG: hypothetical protein ING75_16995 [Rhodocyclaceae bacterium]|nr:hypothetical protein [Rhodocyclaceae bacterium]